MIRIYDLENIDNSKQNQNLPKACVGVVKNIRKLETWYRLNKHKYKHKDLVIVLSNLVLNLEELMNAKPPKLMELIDLTVFDKGYRRPRRDSKFRNKGRS